MDRYVIDDVRRSDAEDICRIYNHYVENSVVTFELKPVDVRTMEELSLIHI